MTLLAIFIALFSSHFILESYQRDSFIINNICQQKLWLLSSKSTTYHLI